MSRPSIRVTDTGDRIRLRWFCDDTALWNEILKSFKQSFVTHADRSYSGSTKTWSVPTRHREALARWVSRWFVNDVHWESEPRDRAQSITDAYRTLHLLPTAPPEVVQAAHRVLVKLTHPDAGGTHEAAVAINRAIAIIRTNQLERAG
jgi:hypothetical protein